MLVTYDIYGESVTGSSMIITTDKDQLITINFTYISTANTLADKCSTLHYIT